MTIKSNSMLLFLVLLAVVVFWTAPAFAAGKGRSDSLEVLITTQTYTGDLGGPYGATAKCQSEFVGARFCSYALDGLRQVSDLPDFHGALQAWVDALPEEVDPPSDNNCQDWTNAIGDNSSTLGSDGAHLFYHARCDDLYPIACCRK